jgi:outer membrane lipoprotein-sorting protein
MKKRVIALFSLLFFLSSVIFSQSVKDVLDNHFETIGQDKVLKVNTMIMKGKIIQQGMEFPILMKMKRPNKVRMEASVQGQKIVTSYDGENGWTLNPMMGSLEPQDLNPDQVKEMKSMGDMDGDLYDYEAKGHQLEYLGEEEMEGTPTYKLKLTKKDGDVAIYYFDADSYVILKTETITTMQGVEQTFEQFPGNYQMIEGMAMPFSITGKSQGMTYMEIVIDTVEIDKEIPDSLFVRPVK